MRIIFLIEELGGGGKERRLVELLKVLSQDANFEIHLILTKELIEYTEVNDLTINIHSLYGFTNLILISEYSKLIKKIKPDIVHAWSIKTSFYAAVLKPFYGFKFISGFIGDSFGFSKLQLLLAKFLIFKNADVVISNSYVGLSAYQVPKDKGRVIYNGFDIARISTNIENKFEKLGVDTRLKIVMLANVTLYKNYKLFINIAESVVKQRDDVTFISIGKIHPEFKSLTNPYIDNKNNRIKFLGFRSDVADLIKDCDIGLLCTYTEGISNSIIELMANGVPVITNDITGGSKEIIDTGKDGLICEDDSILESLISVLDDNERRSKLSNMAKDKIFKKFTLKKMSASYYDIYK